MHAPRVSIRKLVPVFVSVLLILSTVSCSPGAIPTAAPAALPAVAATQVPATAPAQPAAPTKAPEPTKKPVQLVIAAASQYGETLDIFQSAQIMVPHSLIYEPLIRVDDKLNFRPGLADKWEVSHDGLTYTFYLHKGVKFHDGSPFNADVVVWWFNQMKVGLNSYMFETMTGAKAVDEYTVQVTFKDPFPNMLYNLSTTFCGMQSKVAYEKYGKEYGTKYAVGTGPFMFKEWVPNDHVLVVKNPDYNWAPEWTGHKGPAGVDSILYRIIPEEATRVVELKAGNVHILVDPPSPREQAQFKNDPNYNFVVLPSMFLWFVGMNVNEPMLKDIRTRHAIGYAIDRQLIYDTLYQGLGSPTNLYLPRELGSNTGVAEVAPIFDLAKAKSLLAEAGWKPGSDGILVADNVAGVKKGTKFEVSYWSYQDDAAKRLAEVTQKMLSNVGIKANIQVMDNPTYNAQLKKGGHQLILREYGWDNNDILEWFHHSKNLPYPNYLGTNDKKLDAMLDDANYKTATWAERDAKYAEIQKYLIQDLYPWATFFQDANVFISRSTVKGFNPLPLRGQTATFWAPVTLVEQ